MIKLFVIYLDPGDRRWVGMWWGGFLLCGLLLLLVAVPFFSFPKVLTREKKKLRSLEEQNLKSMTANNSNSLQRQQQQQTSNTKPAAQTQNLTGNGATSPSSGTSTSKVDSGYGKDIKGKIFRKLIRRRTFITNIPFDFRYSVVNVAPCVKPNLYLYMPR